MRKIVCLFMLCICLSGCFGQQLTTVYLTSSEEVLIIPKGESFNAIGVDNALKKHTALDDLVVLYKGKLLELEKEANMKVLKVKKTGNSKAIFSGIGTLIATLIAVLFMKKKKVEKNG